MEKCTQYGFVLQVSYYFQVNLNDFHSNKSHTHLKSVLAVPLPLIANCIYNAASDLTRKW